MRDYWNGHILRQRQLLEHHARHKAQPGPPLTRDKTDKVERRLREDTGRWKKLKDNRQIWPPTDSSTQPQDSRNLCDSRGGKPLWGVHCTVNELLRRTWSDAKWSDLLGQLYSGMLCYIPDTPLSLTERLAEGSSLGICLSLKKIKLGYNLKPCSSSDGGVMSAESMSMMVLKGRRSSLFQVQKKKKKGKMREAKEAEQWGKIMTAHWCWETWSETKQRQM